ncbi:MAG: glycolate oxidase subunit GlcE [Zoogloeaceae bacterium]|nr:glycolate oxidase subunit GlcE [Zoogloeaceae bacterium]MCK6383860.1 glycolate oxidase subunit GlcE [Rhodocyclaceae bacterium]
MNDLTEQLRERVLAAAVDKVPLRIRGGGSKDFYGNAPEGALLETHAHTGLVAYEPTELVVTVRAGTRLAELETVLAEQGQMLAFEPPHFGEATVGGCVAAGLSGPRRATAGAVRDFVLGVKLLDGKGEVLNFGGQVMKNVAGYDVSRLMAGAMGTLGLLLEVSLKVLPKPPAEATLRLALPQDRAIEALNRWGGQPLPLSATCWSGGALTVRLSGARAAVAAARGKIGGEGVNDAEAFWRGVREQQMDFFSGASALWRISLPSTTAPLALPGGQLVEWGGALRWLKSDMPAAQVLEAAVQAGGHATLFRGGDRTGGVFQPLPAPLMAIHKNLKRSFDPQGLFNPGRLYPEL